MEPILKHIIIEARIPESICISDLSSKFPDVEFKITNGHWIASDERILYITSKDWKHEYFDFFKKYSSVKNLQQIGNIVKIHIKSKFLESFEQKEMTILYPTLLRNRKHRIEFLMNESQLSSLRNGIKDMKILKIADSYKLETKLTERQEEILWKAYSFGYFKYPRDITLTNLAKLLKISKATLSQTLRTIENKAIKQFIAK